MHLYEGYANTDNLSSLTVNPTLTHPFIDSGTGSFNDCLGTLQHNCVSHLCQGNQEKDCFL